MIDRKIVIAELQNIQRFFEAKADMSIGNGKMKLLSWANVNRDAVEMLKEREALAVEEGKVEKCVCGNEINRYWHPEYCGFCGKKLEWY